MINKIKIGDIRLKKVQIKNFKNVKFGEVSLINNVNSTAEVLGLYGQNGSGKTALIDSLSLLKNILSGRSIKKHFADYIKVDSDYSELTYYFSLTSENSNKIYNIEYSFKLKKINSVPEYNYDNNNLNLDIEQSEYKPVIVDENLSYSVMINNSIVERKHSLMKTDSEEYPFVPIVQYNAIIDNTNENNSELFTMRKISYNLSKSFIFSSEFLNFMRENRMKHLNPNAHIEISNYILESMIYYGNFRLFVFDVQDSTMLNLNILPLSFNYKLGKKKINGNIVIPVNDNGTIPEETFDVAQKVIKNMNIVLQQIIPHLTISMRKLGTEINKNNQRLCRVQLFSNKNSKEIPLCYESEGIKKIFSILNLLINVYNNYSFTVAIDELDSGVFEYLLGEILKIISTKGKGQLIFTSHNLRPLETLNKNCIAFTTTNPDHRYIRPKNIKSTNNLRDFYYRDIILGENNEDVYDTTNNYEIAHAFRKAGDYCGS